VTISAATMQGETAQGLRLHRAGNLSGAARCYEAAVARDPGDAEASCLLGIVLHEQGRPGEGVEWIERAVAMRPDVPAYHASLGLALRSLGESAQAVDALARALELDPDDAPVHVNRGVMIRALGDRDAALTHFRRAVEIAPNLAHARTNLGELLLELGRPMDALPHCQAAAAIDPGLVEAHLNLGDVLLGLGRTEAAADSFLRAYQLDERRAQAAAGLGLVAARYGAWNDALAWFHRAVEQQPGSVDYLRYLAEATGVLGLYPEVKSCCERILAIDPDQAVAHNALAWLLQDAGRYAEADEHYRAAIRLQPDFATAHFNFGVLHEEMGDLAEAEARYRSTLQYDPAHATALARLTALLRDAIPEEDSQSVHHRLTQPDLPPRDRANLLFALAMVHDGRGQFPDAANCLVQANALALEDLARQGLAYDRAEHRRFVDGLIAAFPQGLFEQLFGLGVDTSRPVFIIGLPRSGTTLIEQVLASHPHVHGAGEVTLARRSFEEVAEFVGRGDGPLAAIGHLDAPTIQELARRHEQRLFELDGGRARRVIGKLPDNYLYLGLIALLFPRAVVIHCRRDLRDVALSCWSTNFKDVRWANHEDHIASRFEDYFRLMDHWSEVLPLTFQRHDVAYEDAVADLEGVARRILSALELDWDPACLEFHRTRRPVKTASQVQVRRPVYRGSVGRWMLYRDELASLFAKVEGQSGILSERHAVRK
jgi:tetratricopeptide (TPR) repeat protein